MKSRLASGVNVKGIWNGIEDRVRKAVELGDSKRVSRQLRKYTSREDYGSAERLARCTVLFGSQETAQFVVSDFLNLLTSRKDEHAGRICREFAYWLRQNRFEGTSSTQESLLTLWTRENDSVSAEAVFQQLVKGSAKVQVYDQMMEMYSRQAKPAAAIRVMELSRKCGLPLTSRLWNHLLQAYLAGGDVQNAELSLRQMQNRGFQPDVRSLECFLRHFTATSNTEEMRRFYDLVREGFVGPLDRLTMLLLTTYVRIGQVQEALNFLEESLDEKSIMWRGFEMIDELMIELMNVKDMSGCISVWNLARERELEPSATQCSIALRAATESNDENLKSLVHTLASKNWLDL
ncbi:hypothetical protein NDN08_005389 [Rhodosorus marinus]|uniref:Pentacotripeptide-repeat region of PRORP domain-containing protein n=1 Tax=Rhodosorus marinus TaxID=101924 RepID=A0AAV8V1T8_9RHOD|nr:hypothetical protein NDN08_005389 [Rhodosorus marinus]